MQEGSNSRASARTILSTVNIEFEAHEKLPLVLRKTVYESNLNWASSVVLEMYQRYGERLTILALLQQEIDEIHNFARKYWPKVQGEYPFLSARGTIQRYNSKSY